MIFTRKLKHLGIPHMISGSVAAIYYGEPRMTNDVDIIVLLKDADLPRLAATFPLEEFYCPPRSQPAASQPAAEPTSNNIAFRGRGPSSDRSDQARETHLHEVESELAEITNPLDQNIASSMFKAEVSESQSVVTGGALTLDSAG